MDMTGQIGKKVHSEARENYVVGITTLRTDKDDEKGQGNGTRLAHCNQKNQRALCTLLRMRGQEGHCRASPIADAPPDPLSQEVPWRW